MRSEVTSHGNRIKSEQVGNLTVTYNREWDGRQARTVYAGATLLGVVTRRPHSATYEYSALRADGVHKGAIQKWPDVLKFLTALVAPISTEGFEKI